MRADKSVGLLSLFIGHESDHWCFRLSFTNIANAVRSLPTHNFIVKEDSGPKIHSGFVTQSLHSIITKPLPPHCIVRFPWKRQYPDLSFPTHGSDVCPVVWL